MVVEVVRIVAVWFFNGGLIMMAVSPQWIHIVLSITITKERNLSHYISCTNISGVTFVLHVYGFVKIVGVDLAKFNSFPTKLSALRFSRKKKKKQNCLR